MIKRVISFLDRLTGSKWFMLTAGIILVLRTIFEYAFGHLTGQFTTLDALVGGLGVAALVWVYREFREK